MDYIACQAPLSMELSRQEYWSGLSFPPGDFPNPGIKLESPVSSALTGGFFTIWATRKALWEGGDSANKKAFFGKLCVHMHPHAYVPCDLHSAPWSLWHRDQFHGRQFFHGLGGGKMVSGWFKCVTFIVHFISLIVISAPPQMIKYETLEFGDK